MVKDGFKSLNNILNDMVNNPESEHRHNINRLIQEFGKDKKSEINKLYLSYKKRIGKKDKFLPYAVPLETYERTRESLYFSDKNCIPPDCLISNEQL